MNNIDRLKMSIDGINLSEDKLIIYLEENSLIHTDQYNPTSNTNKKNIYKTALNILEDIANNPSNMKNYKDEDITISNFAENLQNRIDQLERKIRQIPEDYLINNDNGSSFIYMFTE